MIVQGASRCIGVWRLPSGIDPVAFSGLVLTQVGYNCGARAPVKVGAGAIVLAAVILAIANVVIDVAAWLDDVASMLS